MELLKPGDKIFGDRYRVIEYFSGGGQAFGFKGEDLEAPSKRDWERLVFIKQYYDIAPESSEALALVKHFKALNDRLRRKSHYLCLPCSVWEDKSSVIAVFEFVRGRSLRACMEEGLAQEQCIRFALAIANAIRILNNAGVAHLDLKPENLLIEMNDRSGALFVRVIDTDAARIDGIALRENKIYKSAGYMSPEHFAPDRYRDLSDRSDVFTLGIMLFELLPKQHPFPGKNYSEAVENGDFEVPPNPYHRDVIGQILMRSINR